MPEQTPIRKFLDSLQSGQTNTTQTLETIFANMDPNGDLFQWFDTPNVLDDNLPSNVRAYLRGHGMSEKEIDHIDHWPNDAKEAARQAVADAVRAGTTIRHRWGLTHMANPAVDPPASNNGQTITYLSSQHRLRASLRGAIGDVTVDP